jgi:hypothetical protein
MHDGLLDVHNVDVYQRDDRNGSEPYGPGETLRLESIDDAAVDVLRGNLVRSA